jgi:N6-adenosine-specific RNA methylase IME4
MDSTGKIDPAFKLLKVARAREAYEARREKGGTVSDLVALAASGYRAGVIAPDCPWPFETWGGESGKDRAAENHYRTMTLAEIKAFGERYVKPLAAENCALLMWCTWPLVAPGDVLADIIRAWGFEPKTLGFIWIKTNQNGEGLHWGNGYYTRSKSEPVLLATRGSPLRLATDVHQVVMAPVGTHSAKPDEVYARIERLFAGPYLELFARKPRPRWTTWGDEVPPCVLQDGEVLS